MKVFISTPMRGKTKEEILADFTRAEKYFEEHYDNVELANPLPHFGEKFDPIYMLGRAIQRMSEADLVYFCKGWEQARGCRIENQVARDYNKAVLEERE